MASHEINRLTVRIDGNLNLATRQRLQDEVLKELESLFDLYFPGEQITEISNITLDLGTFLPFQFFQQCNYRISLLLRKEFDLLKLKAHGQPSDNVKSVSQLLMTYLAKGTAGKRHIQPAELFSWLLKNQPNELDRILVLLQASPAGLLRLFNQIPFDLLEAYWKLFLSAGFMLITRKNQIWLDQLAKRGLNEQQLGDARILLRQITFQFLSGKANQFTENHYNLFADEYLRENKVQKIPSAKSLSRLIGLGRTGHKQERKTWIALLSMLENGRLTAEATSIVFGLSSNQVRLLADLFQPGSPRLVLRLNRIFALLNSNQIIWFLSALSDKPGFQEPVRMIRFLENLMRRTLKYNLLNQSLFLISTFLGSPSNKLKLDYLVMEILNQVLVSRNQSRMELAMVLRRAMVASRHNVAREVTRILEQWEIVELKMTLPNQNLLLEYFRHGRWLSMKPLKNWWSQVSKRDAQMLADVWKLVEKDHLAWQRLMAIGATPESLEKVFRMVYSSKSSVAMVWEMASEVGRLDAMRIWNDYVRIRALGQGRDEEQRKKIIPHVLGKKGRQRRFNDTEMAVDLSRWVLPDEVDGWTYVKAFLHWLKYGTFILQELESDGTLLTLTRIYRQWPEVLIKQLRREPERNILIKQFFTLLPESEHRSWLRIMAPRMEPHWETWKKVGDLLILNNADWIALLVTIEFSGLSVEVDDFRLDKIFELLYAVQSDSESIEKSELITWLRGEVPAAAISAESLERVEQRFVQELSDWQFYDDQELISGLPEEWLRLGVQPKNFPQYTFLDFLIEVVHSGNFPHWSVIYSPGGLIKLLNIGSPAAIHRIIQSEFRSGWSAGPFLTAIGLDNYLSWLNLANRDLLDWITSTIGDWIPVLEFLGDKTAVSRYLQFQLLTHYYRHADRERAVRAAIVTLQIDFAIPEQDLTVRLSTNLNLLEGFTQLFDAQKDDSKHEDVPKGQQETDLLIHLLTFGQKPWWWKEEATLLSVVTSLINSKPKELLTTLSGRPQSKQWLTIIFKATGEEIFITWLKEGFHNAFPVVKAILGLMSKWHPHFDKPAFFSFILLRIEEFKVSGEVQLVDHWLDHLTALFQVDRQTIFLEMAPFKPEVSAIPGLMKQIRTARSFATDSALPGKPDWRNLIDSFFRNLSVPRFSDEPLISKDSFLRGMATYIAGNTVEAMEILKSLYRQPQIRARLLRQGSVEIIRLVLSTLAATRAAELETYRNLIRRWILFKSGNAAALYWDDIFIDRMLLVLSEDYSKDMSASQLVADSWRYWVTMLGGNPERLYAELSSADLPAPLLDALFTTISITNQGQPFASVDHLRTIQKGVVSYGNDWLELLNAYRKMAAVLQGLDFQIPPVLLEQAFYKFLELPGNLEKSPRFTLAQLAANLVRDFQLDPMMLVDRLKAGGYPPQWVDALLQDAGLQLAEKQPTTAEAIGVKLAYYDASFTLLHYLKLGEWPIHFDKSGLDFQSFLAKLSHEPGVDLQRIRLDLRMALRDQTISLRVSMQESFVVLNNLITFLFPKSRTRLFIFSDWLVPLLTQHDNRSEEELSRLLYRILLTMAVDTSAQYQSADELQEVLLSRLMAQLRPGFQITNRDLAFQILSPGLIQRLTKRGWLKDFSANIPDHQISDLLIHVILEREIPWWAADWPEKFDTTKNGIRRLATLAIQTDPEHLIDRLSNLSSPSSVYLPLLTYLDDDLFLYFVAAFHPRRFVPWIKWIEDQMKQLEMSVDVLAWRSFLLGQLFTRPTEMKLMQNSMDYLSLALGLSRSELAVRLAGSIKKSAAGTPSVWIRFLEDLASEFQAAEEVNIFSEVLTYYLEHGSIPASQSMWSNDYEGFYQYLQQQVVFGDERVRSLMLKSMENVSIMNRIIIQTPVSILSLFVRVLFPNLFRELTLQHGIWFRFFRDQGKFITMQLFDRAWYGALFTGFGHRGPVYDSIESIMVIILKNLRSRFAFNMVIGSEVLRRYGVNNLIINEMVRSEVGVRNPEERPLESLKDELFEEEMEIGNAGLVIVWPFLAIYFERLGMMEKGAFISEDSAIRAVLLLQYIATGAPAAPEHNLMLNKVLCGVPLNTPVPSAIELNTNEEEITSQMLNSLLQNWEKLKDSSIDALREGFLIRDGYLRETEQTWELRVEKKTIDILMDSMSWSFGTIKLSWIKKRIIVKWR